MLYACYRLIHLKPTMKVVWKYTTVVNGEQCVTLTDGVYQIHELCAKSWVTQMLVLASSPVHMDLVATPSLFG